MAANSNKNGMSYMKEAAQDLGKLMMKDKKSLASTAGAFLGAELVEHLPLEAKMKNILNAGATGHMLATMNVPGMIDEWGNPSDFMMHSLNTALAGYGILANDKDAIQTSALMSLLFKLSHDAQHSAEEKLSTMRKEIAAHLPGVALLAGDSHAHGDHHHGHSHDDGHGHHHHHDHGPVYANKEDAPFKLDKEEQETMERLFDKHHPKTMKDIKKAYDELAGLKEKIAKNELEDPKKIIKRYVEKYDYIIAGHEGELIEDNKIPTIEEIEKELLAEDYNAFCTRFDAMIYLRHPKNKDGTVNMDTSKAELVHAHEIKRGDVISVEKGKTIPTDGTVDLVNGRKTGFGAINPEHYSGDKKKHDIYQGVPIFQMGVLTDSGTDSVTYTATENYWKSTGAGMMDGFGKEDLSDSEKGLNRILKRYVNVMLGVGGFLFFKDAVKKSEEGRYLDFATLTSKKNISKTFEYFVSAAPCPLTASMLVYKGIEDKLKQSGTDIFIQNRNKFIDAKDTDVVVLDITGTLTTGECEIKDTQTSQNVTDEAKKELEGIAFLLERMQDHHVAAAIRGHTRENAFEQMNNDSEFELDNWDGKKLAKQRFKNGLRRVYILFKNIMYG